MTARHALFATWVALCLSVAACGGSDVSDVSDNGGDSDAASGDARIVGDGSPATDGARDTGGDVTSDAGEEASLEASTDDAGDAESDANVDAGMDADVDAGPCPDGGVACSSACVDTTSDDHNCSACGNDCSALAQVATSSCVSSTCVITCNSGHGDCNTNPADGCETDLSLPGTCGLCTTSCAEPTPSCAPSGDTFVCVSGCSGLTPDRCDMTCVDTTSNPNDCGVCDNVCPTPANATATCVNRSCGFTCATGFLLIGGACVVPPAPRPTAPLSTSGVTSRRPTLHWVLPTGVTDATLDLCLDRACTTPIGSPIDVTGTSYALTSDLPIGVVYWRLHPATVTTVSSATWEFTVGALSAAVDSSWGTTLDVNGDGFADLAVGAFEVSTETGSAYVYLGSASGFATTPTTTLIGPDGANGQFGRSLASAGDVNGDGYADLIVGALGPPGGTGTGAAHIYLGSASGLATTPATTVSGPTGVFAAFGWSVSSAGDVDGDGYADVVVGAPEIDTAYVYLGSAAGLGTTAASTLLGPDGVGSRFGLPVASAGDLNGDGYSDVAIGAGEANGTGSVYIYFGSASGLPSSPNATFTGPDGANGDFGSAVASAGDIDADGYADLIVGAPLVSSSAGKAYVYLGSATTLATAPVTTLVPPAGGEFGLSVATTSDVNGDGYADVAVGAITAASNAGRVYLYLGSSSGLSGTPATTLIAPDGSFFGTCVASAGDMNGDTYSELAVGASTAASAGRAYVYPGGSSGIPSSPTVTLTGPDGAGGRFGNSIFGANN